MAFPFALGAFWKWFPEAYRFVRAGGGHRPSIGSHRHEQDALQVSLHLARRLQSLAMSGRWTTVAPSETEIFGEAMATDQFGRIVSGPVQVADLRAAVMPADVLGGLRQGVPETDGTVGCATPASQQASLSKTISKGSRRVT